MNSTLNNARRRSREKAGGRPPGTLVVTYGNQIIPITIFVTADEWRKHFERHESDWDYRFEYGQWPYV